MRQLSCTLAAAALSCVPSPPAAASAPAGLYEICINGTCSAPAGVRVDEAGRRWIEAAAFEELGLRHGDWPAEEHEGVLFLDPLSRFPEARSEVDEGALQLWLALPAEAWPERRYSDGLRSIRPRIMPESHQSVYLDYSLLARDSESPNAFGELGLVRGAWLLRSSFDAGDRARRGMSALEFDQPRAHRRWVLGDQHVATGDVFGAAALVGGVGVGSAFELDPYLVRSPGANVHGVMSAPGTVDIYANGQLVTRQAVEPGPFSIRDLALAQGSSDIRIVVNDPFAGTYEVASLFYGSSRLLSAGIHEYAYRIGRLRPRPFEDAYDPGTLVSGYHRYGFNDWFTAGVRHERLEGRANSGASADVRTPLGSLGLSTALGNDGRGRSGWARRMDYHYQSRRLALGLGWHQQDEDYVPLQQSRLADLVEPSMAARNAMLSIPLREGTSLALGNARLKYRDGSTMRNSSVRLSSRIGPVQMQLESGRLQPRDGAGEGFCMVNILLPLEKLVLGVAATHGDDGSANVVATAYRHRASLEQGWSYRAELGRMGDLPHTYGEADHAGRHGNLRMGMRHRGSQVRADARFTGSLLLADHDIYATTSGAKGYALVRTNGMPDVPVQRERQAVGRTDANGRLLVSNLFPYHASLISIDTDAMDIHQRIDEAEQYVSVRRHGLAYVDFALRPSNGAQARLLHEGRALRYGRAWLEGHDEASAVRIGVDGEVYLEGIAPGEHLLRAVADDGTRLHCPAQVPPATPIAWLGDVTCVRE